MNIVAICRGAPGLGRVVPSLALVHTLASNAPVTVTFATYGAGARYLNAVGMNVVDLGDPDGLFIDSVAPQALRALEVVEHARADLVLIDGEFYLPATLAHLAAPVVYLANPHDLLGAANTFRRVNRRLLGHADAVLISSLSSTRPTPRPELVPGTTCLEVPALTKPVPLEHHRGTGPPRVLVSTGGGSLRSQNLRAATDKALAAVLDALAPLAEAGRVGDVNVVLGMDAALPQRWRNNAGWLHTNPGPVELADLYAHHEVLIARAGRNTLAEAGYCGIPTVALPIVADPHRGSEQTANADAVAHLPGMFPLHDWHDPATVRQTLTHALDLAQRGPRPTGPRGNDGAAAFLTRLAADTATPMTITS